MDPYPADLRIAIPEVGPDLSAQQEERQQQQLQQPAALQSSAAPAFLPSRLARQQQTVQRIDVPVLAWAANPAFEREADQQQQEQQQEEEQQQGAGSQALTPFASARESQFDGEEEHTQTPPYPQRPGSEEGEEETPPQQQARHGQQQPSPTLVPTPFRQLPPHSTQQAQQGPQHSDSFGGGSSSSAGSNGPGAPAMQQAQQQQQGEAAVQPNVQQRGEAAAFFELLEELVVTSVADWEPIQALLELECWDDERYRAAKREGWTEELFQEYVGMQAQLEPPLAEQVDKEGVEMQALELHSAHLQLLPAALGELSRLNLLDLRGCTQLQQLPAAIWHLSELRFLELPGCVQLACLPPAVGQLSSLQTLNLTGCAALQQLPDSIGQLSSLQTLHLSGCTTLQQLPESLCFLVGLQWLSLSGCTALQQLPAGIGQLSLLLSLDLAGCSFEQLPAFIGQLGSLVSLVLSDCSRLRQLPPAVGQLSSLQTLQLEGCTALQYLPPSIGQLASLRVLSLSCCSTLEQLPGTIGELCSLQTLDLSGCSTLQRLPAAVGQLYSLAALDLSCCAALRELPDLSSCQDLELRMTGRMPGNRRQSEASADSDGTAALGGAAAAHGASPWRYLQSLLPRAAASATGIGGPPTKPTKMPHISVPVDHLPPRLAAEQPSFVLGQAGALHRLTAIVAWIAVLLATASFVGMVTVPGGNLKLGLSQVGLRGTQMNRAALRSYFMCNIATFFLALATAVFCATENLPRAAPSTAPRVIRVLLAASALLLLTVAAAGATFLSAVFAVFPANRYSDLIPPAAAAGAVLLLVLGWYISRVLRLVQEWRRMHSRASIPNLIVTAPDQGSSHALKAVLIDLARSKRGFA